MAVVLALASALAFGVVDFAGGLVSRHTSPCKVGVALQAGTALSILPWVPWWGGAPTLADHGWGIAAGLFAGVGIGYFYRGLAHGRMGVVAPVSAIGTAMLPAITGLLLGERPSPMALAGVLIAFPGVWLVASTDGRDPHAHSGLADGLVAGAAFGGVFTCLGQVGAGAGLLPLFDVEVAGVIGLVITAVLAGAAWAPRDRFAWRAAWLGPLAAAAMATFQVATHHGYLTVVAVIAALYPAPTVALAAFVLRERIRPAQAVGLGLAAVAVALVATG